MDIYFNNLSCWNFIKNLNFPLEIRKQQRCDFQFQEPYPGNVVCTRKLNNFITFLNPLLYISYTITIHLLSYLLNLFTEER